MKTIVESRELSSVHAAEHIAALLKEKADAVLALCGGETPKELYRVLVKLYNDGALSLKKAKILLAADYVGLPDTDERLCANELKKQLIDKTDAETDNCCFINEENFESYDAVIEDLGGIDLCVLGIGTNAHIGFNEPATQFGTLSHRQKLTDKTKRAKAALFGGEDKVPEYGVTMGIKTITRARDIIVMAFGEEKAGPVFEMLYARDDSVFPAAFLQLPLNVTVYADEAAAKLI